MTDKKILLVGFLLTTGGLYTRAGASDPEPKHETKTQMTINPNDSIQFVERCGSFAIIALGLMLVGYIIYKYAVEIVPKGFERVMGYLEQQKKISSEEKILFTASLDAERAHRDELRTLFFTALKDNKNELVSALKEQTAELKEQSKILTEFGATLKNAPCQQEKSDK